MEVVNQWRQKYCSSQTEVNFSVKIPNADRTIDHWPNQASSLVSVKEPKIDGTHSLVDQLEKGK